MKRLILLLLPILFLFSCRNDENVSSNNQFVGTWQPVSLKSTASNGQNSEYLFTDCEKKSALVLNSDKKGTLSGYSQDDNGNCQAQGVLNFTYEYKESSKILTLKTGYEDMPYEVKSVTSTQLVLGETIVMNDVTITNIMTYKKL